MTIHEIWSWNKTEEMNLVRESLRSCNYISVDTEFPGCLRETAMEASDDTRYQNLRFNVDRTKPIQLGFSLFDSEGAISGTWEVNFSDFDETEDPCNEKSIAFLKRNGLDFQRIREEGVGIKDFFAEFTQMIKDEAKKMNWVTFDGSYDLGYIVQSMTGRESLPDTSQGFQETVQKLLGLTFDVKKLAGQCRGLNSRFGLQRLADELGITRVGEAHHAGSDSQLTARVFTNINLTLSRDLKRKREHEDLQHQREIVRIRRECDRLAQHFFMQQQVMEQEILMRRCMPRRCYGPVHPPRPIMYAHHPSPSGYFVVPVAPQLSNYL
ncbi:putative CCR4-associated factor 1-like protein 5 [Raphanus sativus]|uniref:poly(A)-specific ribonuclease n=1 Tax=Raphanus sativus TaxID=3726 RepID=A0A6J0NXU1_RAPSA|nr:probable CCR4-associated factor 1 homolog 5 [Raphanus sativus]KAJ4895004.1 putative CCR4-associated factor 1-like protein 5 [Raphanus sativus]